MYVCMYVHVGVLDRGLKTMQRSLKQEKKLSTLTNSLEKERRS